MSVPSIEIENGRIWYDPTWVSEPSERLFDPEFWQQQNKVVGSATGRGTTWFIQLDGIQAALRHYRRGGLFGKLVKDQYWFSQWDKTRSAEEFRLLLALKEAGVHVPRPIAARAVKSGLCYRADLLSERIPQAQDLVSLLEHHALPEAQYHAIGSEIAKMHQTQVNHTDLNIHNILVDADNQVWIIDFDKCCFEKGEAWKAGNLARLKRSFLKEQTKRNIHWRESEFAALIAGYNAL